MSFLRRVICRLLGTNEGATSVEYAIMLALIIVVAVGAILRSGGVQRSIWFNSQESIQDVTANGPQL
jgi:Flp pilus assembly pilin Flp